MHLSRFLSACNPAKAPCPPDNKNFALLSQWPKVKGYPHLFVLDADGKLLHSQNTGDLVAEEGKDTHDKPKVMAFINQQIAKKIGSQIACPAGFNVLTLG